MAFTNSPCYRSSTSLLMIPSIHPSLQSSWFTLSRIHSCLLPEWGGMVLRAELCPPPKFIGWGPNPWQWHTPFYCTSLYWALCAFFFFLTNRRLVATLHQASLLAPFFQRHLTTLCLRVTFSQFLQYFKLFNYYYICYSDVWCALLKLLCIYLFGCAGSRCCVGFCLVAVSQGYSSLQCMGFSLCFLLLLWSMGSRAHRLPYLQSAGSVVVTRGLSSFSAQA